ncbi:MAG: hypothetical protein NWE98_08140 [Candidatus Bathyarchaeota archaeon]|nr:hypothetical protein [Candidatus Bathyarchaeota archaeon]
MSKLIFRTPAGAVSIPAGTSKQLGVVDVSAYSRIRIFANERPGPSNVNIRITLTEGAELVSQLDTLVLSPKSSVTRMYEVPGATLTIFADALPGTGNDGVDFLVYASP